MNLTLNSLAPTPAAPDAAPAAASAQASAPAAAAQPGAALAVFAQWLGLGRQADATALLAGAPLPAADGADAPETDAPESTGQPTPADQPQVIALAAMAMSLMAPPQAPALVRAPGTVTTDEPASESAALPLTAAELRTGLATAAPTPAAAPAAPTPAPAAATAHAAAPAASGDTQPPAKAAGQVVSQPAAAPAQLAHPVAAEARASAPLQAALAATSATDAKPADAAPLADAAAPATDRPAGVWSVGSAAPAPMRAAADGTVALAGPPTAWRQTLHEALGERLNLQLSNRAEQAVIRLDPPMLGRVDIAIRHSAGALEVTISATHGEVVRQLNAVSENLRNDLAARQFTDVAVTVAQAPRSAQAAPQGDAQGRGRQPGREDQPKDPGRALADAGDPSSTFSLNGRA